MYFAPAPTVGGAPSGISLVTALAMIEVKTGQWDIVLPDSERHYDFAFSPDEKYIAYTQSSRMDAEEPFVTLGILRIKSNKLEQEHTLDEVYAGDIIWSPFKSRIVFQTRNAETGSSVVFYDLDTNVLKYVLRGERADLDLWVWNDADNTVRFEERDWLTHSRSYWYLNPFTGEVFSARVTATPLDDVTVTPTP
jgi:dipeptidyl aminopeptidase/acylaminoacyl peptidase